ncbi:response regulator [Actinoplanes cyaneus]|uniref:Response regulator n=1 Tax=Actinoplanes cyaneus TaxID=52696 RepID=A0A919IPL3_9ACTN|nr:CheY chemotaxis protein or a CheY-like REC (receiver) domain [Actinoplanes cyaneus]GID69870.1 response regulator [Actinoplanes cyaneus]
MRACHPGEVILRCLLVDDNQHFLAAARELLEREGLVVAGTASRTADATRLAATVRPDVALVDIKLGGESGFDLARLLTAPVIMISTHAGDDYADLIAASPAIGFLAKTELSADAVRRMLSIVEERQDG